MWKDLNIKAGWVIGRLLPVKQNRVVFSSFYGRGYGDNPKAIAQALLDQADHLELIWLTKGPREAASLPQNIRACPYNSIKRGIALGTAKVWVDNCRKGAPFKKPGQRYMQTWHGFALKRIEGDAQNSLPEEYRSYALRDSRQIDLMISDSRHMTNVYRSAFWYEGEIAELGAPRNDLLCGEERRVAEEKARQTLGVSPEEHLVLYAPTFRADHSLDACCLDFTRLKEACEARFGGSFRVLVRLHPNIAAQAEAFLRDRPEVLNVTGYPDGQELMAAADLLITDYSSMMFDFLLTGRPCFLFATDIDAYRQDRNFYFSLDALPFPLAGDNDALDRAIRDFDEDNYRKSAESFNSAQGIITDGNAGVQCAKQILRWTES